MLNERVEELGKAEYRYFCVCTADEQNAGENEKGIR